jgi:lipoprotein-releasing system ATP-binding protein
MSILNIFGRHEASIELAPGAPIAELRNVSKSVGHAAVVQNVSMEFYPGELVILTGKSGAGKSSSLSMLEGVVVPDDGEVLLYGRNINLIAKAELQKIKRQHLGIGFQTPMMERSTPVNEEIKRVHNGNGIDVSERKITELADRFDMLHKLESEVGSLSGGEMMRASMMRAMVTDPDLILLDEPTGALDPDAKQASFALMYEITREHNTSIIVVTHEPEVASQYVDRQYVMDRGHVVDLQVFHNTKNPAA